MRTDISNAADIFTALACPSWTIDADERARAAIAAVCARPEMRILAHGATFVVNPTLSIPFRVPTHELVELSGAAVVSHAALSVYVRHALEVAMWHRLRPAPRRAAEDVAVAALACCTTLHYLETLPAAERSAVLDENPAWFQYLARLFRDRAERAPQLAAGLVGFCSRLLPLQGVLPDGICADVQVEGTAVKLTTELLPLAQPSESLLGLGGDSRLRVDPASRLNKYGCSTAPRPVVTFSSCTASSPSDIGYWTAEAARQALMQEIAAGGAYSNACASLIEQTRSEIAGVMGADAVPATEIVLAASGTDCELLALHAALEGHSAPLLTIVIGPDEIGSGSLPAASGRHFDEVAPLMLGVAAGKPVEGLAVERVRVQAMRLREETGEPVPLEVLDADVAQTAREAVANGERVLLHVVDSSKTGMRAPSLASVDALQRELGESLTVLIDAAQMRTRPELLMERVASGAMVMISGSKFFTGAPFSGALVVPPRYAARLESVAEVPAGFAAYISGVDVPPRWQRFRDALSESPNLGLLMRWRTALAEMRAFMEVPHDVKNQWYASFRDAAHGALRRARHLELVDAPIGDRGIEPSPHWDASPTIFTFFLCERDERTGDSRRLDYEEAWEIYLMLNRDISSAFGVERSAADRAVAARPCHAGQPVKIKGPDGRLKGALRFAVGARFVTRLAFDPALGSSPDERLAAQVEDFRLAVAKLELIAGSWSRLKATVKVA